MLCTKCKTELVPGALYCHQCGKKLTATKKSRTKSRGNGTGTAFKRGSTWTAQAVVGYRKLPDDLQSPENAKQRIPIKVTKGGFPTRAAALAYVPTLKAGGSRSDEAPRLSEYWDLYERDELSALGKTKQDAYRIAWKRLEPLHNTRMDAISVSDLRRTVAEACTTYYTAKDVKMLLSALFKLAAADGHVNKDLPSFIVLPQLEEKEQQPFSDTEQAALWKLYESGDLRAAAPLLMIYTGMMPGEAISLRVDQIDLEKRLITGAGMKTKVRKATPIVLAENIIPVVEDLIAHAQPDGSLWSVRKKTWYDHYYATLKAAGCRPLPPYSCRHTTATALAISENIAPQTVRKVMRWSNTRMLDRYAHPGQDDALAAVDTIKKHTAEG